MKKPETTQENINATEPDAATAAATIAPLAEVSTTDVIQTAQGSRVRKSLMMRHFMPTADFVMKEVIPKGVGAQIMLGRVWGFCTETVRKPTPLPDGTLKDSVSLTGIFQSESFLTGEVSDFGVAYLPAAYAEKVEQTFKLMPDIKMVEIDCDIGLEVLGKSPFYTFIVIAYREGEEMAVLRKLRNSRGRPANAPKLLTSASV